MLATTPLPTRITRTRELSNTERQWACSQLFQKEYIFDEDEKKLFLSGPVTNTGIFDVLDYWQHQADEQLHAGLSFGKRVQKNNKAPGFLFAAQWKPTSPIKWVSKKYKVSVLERNVLFIVLLRVRHYCLCVVDLSIAPLLVEYTILDSSRYDAATRSGGRKSKVSTIINEVQLLLRSAAPNRVTEDTKILERKRKEPRGVASQSNHIDCGVFVLFYVDCIRRGFRIKDSLTDGNIMAYRSYLEQQYRYMEELKRQQCSFG
jgi:hypothetical protein